MKLQHTHILEADHVRKRDASVVHKLDPGAEISDHVCASCKAPWIQQTMEGKCLGCGQSSSAIPALEATGLQLTVDGIQWTLKAGTKGSVWLPEEGQGISSEQLKALKRDATINAGDMVTALPLARVESEPTYSDSVLPGQRLTLREMITTNELLDDVQFQGLELGSRPPVRSDFQRRATGSFLSSPSCQSPAPPSAIEGSAPCGEGDGGAEDGQGRGEFADHCGHAGGCP